ncbi:MAG: hypothetical protein WAZ34_01985 [Rhodocyclaceae bacterium]
MIKITSPLDLGIVLRESRTASHIPAADMAALADTTSVSLRRLEQGRPTKAIATLFTILDELGLELYVSTPPSIGPIKISPEQKKPRRTRVTP